jgi:hypothetical protein
MKSELTDEFVKSFAGLPKRVQKTARKIISFGSKTLHIRAWNLKSSIPSRPYIQSELELVGVPLEL